MFYTRLPCPKNIPYSSEYLNQSTRYFPLIGWIIGGISFIAFYLVNLFFSIELAVAFSLAISVLSTGAFHEDGLADAFDGFGGGWNKDKILEIMKDSRIGTYGTIALIFLFLLKFFSLLEALSLQNITLPIIFLLFVSFHSLARLTAINITFTSNYSRADAKSKIKPIAKKTTYVEVIIAYLFGLIPLLIIIFIYSWLFILVLIPLFLLYFFSKRYFEKWIEGYTGDCLGAVEQIAEVLIVISFILIWKFM